MNENQSAPAQPLREDSFDTAVRGYNRQQVMEYMARSNQLMANLEQSLALARADVQRARAEAEHAQAEAEHAQAQAEQLRSRPVETKPVHAEVSERLSQILRLAAEEAEQDRASASEEIATLRSESRAEAERMINEARAEAEHDLAQARETAERELSEAHQAATQELAEARVLADQELQAAHEEAERLKHESTLRSEEIVNEAQRRAGAVNEVSDQRLETLTATHGEAVLRLGQIRDVLADLLDRDAAAGSLAHVVNAVMAPPGSVRPAIDTRAELEDGRTGEIEAGGSPQDDVYAAPTDLEPETVHSVDVRTSDEIAADRAIDADHEVQVGDEVQADHEGRADDELRADDEFRFSDEVPSGSEPENERGSADGHAPESVDQLELVNEPVAGPTSVDESPVDEQASGAESVDERQPEPVTVEQPAVVLDPTVTVEQPAVVAEPDLTAKTDETDVKNEGTDVDTDKTDTKNDGTGEAKAADVSEDPDRTTVHEAISVTAVHPAIQLDDEEQPASASTGKPKPSDVAKRSRAASRS